MTEDEQNQKALDDARKVEQIVAEAHKNISACTASIQELAERSKSSLPHNFELDELKRSLMKARGYRIVLDFFEFNKFTVEQAIKKGNWHIDSSRWDTDSETSLDPIREMLSTLQS
jgi:hypothetical protein